MKKQDQAAYRIAIKKLEKDSGHKLDTEMLQMVQKLWFSNNTSKK